MVLDAILSRLVAVVFYFLMAWGFFSFALEDWVDFHKVIGSGTHIVDVVVMAVAAVVFAVAAVYNIVQGVRLKPCV